MHHCSLLLTLTIFRRFSQLVLFLLTLYCTPISRLERYTPPPGTTPVMMKAARFYSKSDIRIEDIPTPSPKDGEILIDVAWGGICGTDLHEYLIGPKFIPTKDRPHVLTGEHLPVTLGHEFCGHVREVSGEAVSADGTPLKAGQPVMVDPRLNCRSCFSCEGGETNLCGKWVSSVTYNLS